jgi:hypothetical protein
MDFHNPGLSPGHVVQEGPEYNASALPATFIHPSAWKGNSANFALTEFSEVRSTLDLVTLAVTTGIR